ncbi:type 1 glutamine amidotransferase [Companilactobacillus baiquanensis]|uniref:Type 1 glutamine amidotransferase n=1 Tax=Companilactobacillus baiquanensis TaxID=2486005 RepID=A0ABW1UZ19_9LACO|nr:type 1 glutamine amidotransferase [Companilactobacillus baiquanensis]
MRINILQHTPNEGPGAIKDWAHLHGYEIYVYHPYVFGILPSAQETDMLVILGGPMSPNDDLDWIKKERDLIKQLLKDDIPMFGACYGAQQITKTLGYPVGKSPAKEVGWAPVYLQTHEIPEIPEKLMALHWHEEMFEIPKEAELLFSSDLLKNQGFVMNHRVIGLQFHFEPQEDDLKEIVVNDGSYAADSELNQTPKEIMDYKVPEENKIVMFKLLDYITE